MTSRSTSGSYKVIGIEASLSDCYSSCGLFQAVAATFGFSSLRSVGSWGSMNGERRTPGWNAIDDEPEIDLAGLHGFI